ncbi:hypothetical protein KKC87_04425 [Patescibacteria group bacterium]|nr:hypothetical protein [Patescibacteria group bacterium]
MKKTLIVSAVGIFLFLSFFSLQASAYQFTYQLSGTTLPNTRAIPSFATDATCEVTLSSTVDIYGASGMSLAYKYFSPEETVVQSTTRIFTNNASCEGIGTKTVSTESSTGALESQYFYSGTGIASINYISYANYQCNPTSVIDFDFSSDSRGYIPNVYYREKTGLGGCCNIADVNKALNLSQFGLCNGTSLISTAQWWSNQTAGGSGLTRTASWSLPFNTSGGNFSFVTDDSGAIFSGAGTITARQTGYYPLDDPATITTVCTTTTCTGNITVPTNEIYVLFHAVISSQGASETSSFPNPFKAFTLNTYEPDYLCGEYSECINSSQYQTCVDQNGIAPDEFRFRSCFTIEAFEDEVIGFEDSDVVSFLECKKHAFLCTASPEPINLELPVNWTVLYRQVNDSGTFKPASRTAFMTSEEATNGFKSLFIQYIPPKFDEVQQNVGGGHLPATCQNTSQGFVAQIYADLNGTGVVTDITFPSTYSIFQWDIKKAETPYVQYEVWNPFCSPQILCYGIDCDEEPLGDYLFRLIDLNTSSVVLDYYATASNEWDSVIIDLSDVTDVTHQYRAVFAVNPTDQYDPRVHAVYIDNVQVANLPNALGESTEGCSDFCDDVDLWVATETATGICTFDIDYNNSVCIAEAEAGATTTLDPLPAIIDLLNASGYSQQDIEDAGFGFTLFFLSPFFLAFLVVLIVAGYLEYKVAKESKSRGAGGSIFGIIMIFGSVALTIAGIVPIGFAIVFVIIAGFIVANTVMKAMGGG